jgi:hypothetical protein
MAWNDFGHMTVAAVAWDRRSDAAKARATALLKLNPAYGDWVKGMGHRATHSARGDPESAFSVGPYLRPSDSRRWVIPAERMKAAREHRVPLSLGAIEILEARAQAGDTGLVFFGSEPDKPLSSMAMACCFAG